MNGFGSSVGDWLIVVRAIHFAATAMIAGILIFRIGVAEPALRPARQAAQIFDMKALRIVWICLLVSVASGIAWILLQAPAISGLSFEEAMGSGVIGTVVTETQFGQVSEIRLVLAIVLAACLVSGRLAGTRWLGLVSALGLVGSIAWTGHAGSTAGELGILHLIADTLHVVAAGAWIGGLAWLALLLVVTLRRQADGWSWLVQDATRRFSTLGIVSVATLLMSGIANLATPIEVRAASSGIVLRTLKLPALARQLDRNVPRGADDDRASVGAGAANDRFKDQNKLLSKHVRCLVCWLRTMDSLDDGQQR